MTLNIALPVAFNSSVEIEAFKHAKERLEDKMNRRGIDGSVGAFGIAMPGFVLKPRNIEKAYANQEKAQLPIFTTEGPITFTNTLVGNLKNVREGINYFGTLAAMSSSTNVPHSVHHAIFCPQEYNGEFDSNSGAFSLSEYQANADLLHSLAKEHFASLRKMGEGQNIDVCLETEPMFSYEIDRTKDGQDNLIFKPSSDPRLLDDVSDGNIIYDIAHVAASTVALEAVASQGIDTSTYKRTLGFPGSSDKEVGQFYKSAFENLRHRAKAYHVSNCDGINTNTKDKAVIDAWGTPSGSVDGILPPAYFHMIAQDAYQQEAPVVIEIDYDAANIGTNLYTEADPVVDRLLDGLNR